LNHGILLVDDDPVEVRVFASSLTRSAASAVVAWLPKTPDAFSSLTFQP